MRKALKIKASFLCLTWMVIFMHGVIPHMHEHNHAGIESHQACNHGGLCSHSHSHDAQDPLRSVISAFDHNHNQTVCHFNPNLFAKLALDSSFIIIETEVIEIDREESEIQSDRREPKCNKPPLLLGPGLRAPPIV